MIGKVELIFHPAEGAVTREDRFEELSRLMDRTITRNHRDKRLA
jgi:hypothetical protein